MIRDRFEILLDSISKGIAVINPRTRFEELMSAIAVKIGESGGGSSAEIIPITGGDGTNARTFTFESTPKFIALHKTSGNGAMQASGFFVWGSPTCPVMFASSYSSNPNSWYSDSITYDGNSCTLRGQTADVAFNGVNDGLMVVIY